MSLKKLHIFLIALSLSLISCGQDSFTKNKNEKPMYTNALIHETSPYLLQHAHNPVNWYPWKMKLLQKQRKKIKCY